MADVAIRNTTIGGTSKDYTLPGTQELLVKGVRAVIDGSGAAGAYFPVVQILDPAGNVMLTAIGSSSVAAGVSVNVTFFPDVIPAPGGGGGGGGATNLALPFQVPDASGNAHIGLVSSGNTRMIVPAFLTGVDGFWWGVLDVPSNYTSSGAFVLWIAPIANVATVTRFIVGSRPAVTGATWDAAYTTETAQNITLSGTGFSPVLATFTLSTTPVASNSLQFFVERNGSNVADTTTNDVLLLKAMFTYS